MYTAFLLTLIVCITGSFTLYVINCLLHAHQTRRRIDLSNPTIEISLTEEVEYKRVLFWKMRVKKELPPAPANYELNPIPAGNWMIDDGPSKSCKQCIYGDFDPSALEDIKKKYNDGWFWDVMEYLKAFNEANDKVTCRRPKSEGEVQIDAHVDIETMFKGRCGPERKYHALPIHPGQKALQEIYK